MVTIKNSAKINTLFSLFITFFKIGAFTFGGGYAMIPFIQDEVVDKRGWISRDDIVDLLAVGQMIPGAIAINLSIMIGNKVAGRLGAIVSAIAVSIPSFMIILLIATFFTKVQDNPVVEVAFKGIRAAVASLIVVAAFKVKKSAIKDKLTVFVSAIAVIGIVILKIHPIYLIFAGIISGLIMLKVNKKKDSKELM